MAKDEIQKLRDKVVEDLRKDVDNEEKKLQELRFDLARGKVKNSDLVRNSRKNIAKLKTILEEKEARTKINTANEDGK